MELRGKTILITRAAAQSADLRLQLEELGARVIECPTIQIIPPKTWRPVDDAILRLATYDWLLFTSANAVEQFLNRLRGAPCGAPIAVGGSSTAAKLMQHGLEASLVPKDFRAEGLLEAFPESLAGIRILFPRAEVAREALPEELRRRGATVDIVTVYRTVRAHSGDIGKLFETERVDCVVFTSPSTIPEDLKSLPAGTALAAIGPVTEEAAKLMGLRVDIVPEQSTAPALVDAIRRYFGLRVRA